MGEVKNMGRIKGGLDEMTVDKVIEQLQIWKFISFKKIDEDSFYIIRKGSKFYLDTQEFRDNIAQTLLGELTKYFKIVDIDYVAHKKETYYTVIRVGLVK